MINIQEIKDLAFSEAVKELQQEYADNPVFLERLRKIQELMRNNEHIQ